MMGPRQEALAVFYYEFSLDDHVPQGHFLRSIDRHLDLSGIRGYLEDFYSHTGRPSVDPELIIRMLLVGYCFGIRSERRLCEAVACAYWLLAYAVRTLTPRHLTGQCTELFQADLFGAFGGLDACGQQAVFDVGCHAFERGAQHLAALVEGLGDHVAEGFGVGWVARLGQGVEVHNSA